VIDPPFGVHWVISPATTVPVLFVRYLCKVRLHGYLWIACERFEGVRDGRALLTNSGPQIRDAERPKSTICMPLSLLCSRSMRQLRLKAGNRFLAKRDIHMTCKRDRSLRVEMLSKLSHSCPLSVDSAYIQAFKLTAGDKKSLKTRHNVLAKRFAKEIA
jgi:hypothetical protein